jgi:glutamate N-acetyltransferase/amino-acid N-acetyltransferase
MPVNLPLPDSQTLFPIAGVRIGVAEAGIRKVGRKDLTVVLLDARAVVQRALSFWARCARHVDQHGQCQCGHRS